MRAWTGAELAAELKTHKKLVDDTAQGLPDAGAPAAAAAGDELSEEEAEEEEELAGGGAGASAGLFPGGVQAPSAELRAHVVRRPRRCAALMQAACCVSMHLSLGRPAVQAKESEKGRSGTLGEYGLRVLRYLRQTGFKVHTVRSFCLGLRAALFLEALTLTMNGAAGGII